MLQRMMEELLYANPILNTAAASETTLEELNHVVAYSTACYAHTTMRVGKPFNPLLGETYECDRRVELGWRCLLEQVRLCVLGGWMGNGKGELERHREGLTKGLTFSSTCSHPHMLTPSHAHTPHAHIPTCSHSTCSHPHMLTSSHAHTLTC